MNARRDAALSLLDAHRQAVENHRLRALNLDNAFHHTVTACRAVGMTWVDIGHELGTAETTLRDTYARLGGARG